MVLISIVSSPFIDAENLMVGDFETLERWIGCVILIRGCEDQGCLHLSPIWWWQKGEEEYFEDCSLKILDDMHGLRGSHMFHDILTSGEVHAYWFCHYQLGEDCC